MPLTMLALPVSLRSRLGGKDRFSIGGECYAYLAVSERWRGGAGREIVPRGIRGTGEIHDAKGLVNDEP
jgi:hypothetical protein